MRHGFTRQQIKRIILEELEKSKIADDAAEEIVDELGSIACQKQRVSLFLKNRTIRYSQKSQGRKPIDADEASNTDLEKDHRAIERFRTKSFLAGSDTGNFSRWLTWHALRCPRLTCRAQAASQQKKPPNKQLYQI